MVVSQGEFRLATDLTVAPGSKAAILGPSGAGKSTLLSVIAGFLAPDAGRITWNGADLTTQEPGERPLSIVFQDNNLFPHLTAAQNVGLGLSPNLRGVDWARVEDSLSQVGLGGYGPRRPADLSGGQQSRVALARVLLRARPLLLLDEPFAALGPALRAEMLALVKDVAEAACATVLMVSHAPEDAQRLCTQTIAVVGGRAHDPVDTADLLAAPPPELAAYLGFDAP